MSITFNAPLAGHPYQIWAKASGPRPAWPLAVSPLQKAGPGDVLGLSFRLHLSRQEIDAAEMKAIIVSSEGHPERAPTAELIGKWNHEAAARIALSVSVGDPLLGFLRAPSMAPIISAWKTDFTSGTITPVERTLWVFHSTALLMPWHGLYERRRPRADARPESQQIHLFYTPPISAHHALSVHKELLGTLKIARGLLEFAGEDNASIADPDLPNLSAPLPIA